MYVSACNTLPPAHPTNTHFPQLPFYAVMSFGAYLLGRLGLAILTFNDVPEAHAELQKQIEQAKTELRAQNIDVD